MPDTFLLYVVNFTIQVKDNSGNLDNHNWHFKQKLRNINYNLFELKYRLLMISTIQCSRVKDCLNDTLLNANGRTS